MVADYIRTQAESLARLARVNGIVLSISQEPLEPLAMGNVKDVVKVRQSLASFRRGHPPISVERLWSDDSEGGLA